MFLQKIIGISRIAWQAQKIDKLNDFPENYFWRTFFENVNANFEDIKDISFALLSMHTLRWKQTKFGLFIDAIATRGNEINCE